MNVTIRKATGRDAKLLSQLAEKTFRDAFVDDTTPADMDHYVEEAFSPAVIAGEVADESSTFLIAEDGSGAIGYAKLRDGEVDSSISGERPIELQRLYLLQTALARGVGARLMEACLDVARGAGFRTVWLGVWEHNHRAIRFYERWGFRRVGEHTFTIGEDDQVDIVMEREVEAAYAERESRC